MSNDPDTPSPTILEAAITVLQTQAPGEKTQAANHVGLLLQQHAPLGLEKALALPARPARPEQPVLVHPSQVKKRGLGTQTGRAALMHAVAHIEFNAIDLAFDMAARFGPKTQELGLDTRAFVTNWVNVGLDEARHFQMVNKRLHELGCAYGDLPAHDGLWEAAEATAENFAARLAIAPLILEARGLDVTPQMIKKLETAGDQDSADVLKIIYQEEISHVACGKRWFDEVCDKLGQEPAQFFHKNREDYFSGQLKPPFNHEARREAGLSRDFYEPN